MEERICERDADASSMDKGRQISWVYYTLLFYCELCWTQYYETWQDGIKQCIHVVLADWCSSDSHWEVVELWVNRARRRQSRAWWGRVSTEQRLVWLGRYNTVSLSPQSVNQWRLLSRDYIDKPIWVTIHGWQWYRTVSCAYDIMWMCLSTI